jgi:two-component system nitrogen regulation response regulator GlnG
MPRLLVVDDEENVLYSFRRGLAGPGLEIVTASDGATAIESVSQARPDSVILDVRLPDMSGLEVFDRLRRIDARIPVIVVTAHATTDTAIDAMKRGAFEYLVKPVDIHQLRSLVAKSLELSRLQHVPALLDNDPDNSEGADRIVGRCDAMQQVYKTIGRVASENVTVLILGESGTGKELVARAIFHHSQRVDRPFLAINCAALPETLLESELFGHERGAFTGAEKQRIGKFEQAKGGTLFLDELGDMSLATQAKILRVLQDGRFERIGGNETIQTDVRVIAATNQDLESKIKSGAFRSDLLYRLNGFSLRLPPLRDRIEDLPLLVEHFLKLSNQQLSNTAVRLAPEAMDILARYRWPGNVRELQSVIKYAVVHGVGEVITPECLPETCREGVRFNDRFLVNDELTSVVQYVRRRLRAGETDIYRGLLDEIDRIAVRETLRHVSGNQVHASQCLGVSRTTLRAKLASLGFDREDVVPT